MVGCLVPADVEQRRLIEQNLSGNVALLQGELSRVCLVFAGYRQLALSITMQTVRSVRDRAAIRFRVIAGVSRCASPQPHSSGPRRRIPS